jgi:hypothetical protein
LDTLTPTVDESHLAEAGLPGRFQIRLDHRRDVAWREAVKVEAVLDGHVD